MGGSNHGKYWDKEYVELLKAKKQYVCCECGIKIKKDDYYYADSFMKKIFSSRTGSSYKKWWTNRICLFCWTGSKELINTLVKIHSSPKINR